ncbi:ATP synthase A1 subunit C [Halobaculum sp. MBLA0147]|uniref:ATP synthase A1 subunit C n=1 Tax=Halobaculum sp. MBLA0147 TaxID=3079934 RepID=UPI003523CD78
MSSRAGSSNSEYVNARVRSRRSRLYDEESYRRLLRMSPAEIARDMEESTYEREINELGSRFGGVDLIEYALNRNLARQFDDLLGWAEGGLYDLLVRYLRKFDAWNVKTLLRGVYSETPADEVRVDLIEAGELDPTRLERLADADSVEAIVDGLRDTIFGDALAGAYEDYEEVGLLIPLENAVDRAYYELLTEGLGGGERLADYRQYLRAEIDFRNALNAFRLARSGTDLDPAEYFIEGGELFSVRDVQRLAGDMDELIAHIRESPYGDDLSDALDRLEDAESLVDFEHALETAQVEYAEALGSVDPLSVAPVIGFILSKEREVDNIRAIARGKEAGLDADEIEADLVIL